MTTARFDRAHAAWASNPAVHSDANRPLFEGSRSIVSRQAQIAPMLEHYARTDEAGPRAVDHEAWPDLITTMLINSLRRLRRLQQQGRQQVATRELLEQSQLLKEAWDTYRVATGT